MRRFIPLLTTALLAGAALCAAPDAAAEKPLSTWAYPNVWPRHAQLQQQLIDSVRRGDIPTMEATCRAALEVLPGDATWHYNLACALAYREQTAPALDELEKAIGFGFRDADVIAKDNDLARLHDEPRFPALVARAKELAGKPIPGRPAPAPAYAVQGGTATLNETNLVFNFDTGLYDALLNLASAPQTLADLAPGYSASKPDAPERALLIAWLARGSAAGNGGDLYVNRDRGHSMLAVADFPLLTNVRFANAAQPFGADLNHPNTAFAFAPVFGNISRGYTQGPFWRSLARATFTESGNLAARMDLLYLSNQFWVIPCVHDYGKPELGDIFPANAPFQFVSEGISWSDQPFLRAALAASAAFQPLTKKAILRRRLLGPTLQWLLRRTQRGVHGESGYLGARAHPTAFSAKRLDPVALVEKAHALRPEQVPPAVTLSLVNSRLFPVRYPAPRIDYPDTLTELLFATRSAIAFVLRAPDASRTFLVHAKPYPEHDPLATFTWRVVHGNPDAVTISAPLGETVNTPENGYAQIVLDLRKITERIDVACFAKTHGTDYGAPAMVSFYPVPQEARTYRPDGKIDAIDYSNPNDVYCDPMLALPRRWKDTYVYAPDDKRLGFSRSYNGKEAAFFTPTGDRVVARNPDGSARRAVHVSYTSRQTGNPIRPFELTYTDEGEPFDVK